MKLLNYISFSLLFFALTSFAEDEKQPPPLDPAYEGVHGMVLVSHASKIYASHLPMYKKPHNVQLLYKLEVKDVALVALVRDADFVTIKPEPFNLQRLMRGEKLAITADVYLGHFEREGTVVYEGMVLNFDKQLYIRELNDIEDSSRIQTYDVVELGKTSRIFVHQIQKAPSYDHMIHIELESGCINKFATRSAVPSENEVHMKFLNCGTMKPLYYETQDFKKKTGFLHD